MCVYVGICPFMATNIDVITPLGIRLIPGHKDLPDAVHVKWTWRGTDRLGIIHHPPNR